MSPTKASPKFFGEFDESVAVDTDSPSFFEDFVVVVLAFEFGFILVLRKGCAAQVGQNELSGEPRVSSHRRGSTPVIHPVLNVYESHTKVRLS